MNTQSYLTKLKNFFSTVNERDEEIRLNSLVNHNGKAKPVMSIIDDRVLLLNNNEPNWVHKDQVKLISNDLVNKVNLKWGEYYILTKDLSHPDFIANSYMMLVRQKPNKYSGRVAIVPIGKETVRTVYPNDLMETMI